MSYPERDHPYRGLRVIAWIDDDDLIALEGILVSLAIDGEVAIRADDGVITYGWPCLALRLADGAPVWRPDLEPAGDDERWPGRGVVNVWLPGDEPGPA